ncbi:MAG: DUF4342 domain-containing protein [Erysipelotrichaceae bacterium]|jgi:hypothetical protein|nr:DUF4342 domain-containing protein [Erysipelotrichaceae bacterium]
MNFSINEVDQVIARTGCSYEEAKLALLDTDGNVVDAIVQLEKERNQNFGARFNEFVEEGERTTNSIMTKIKEMIAEGNVNRIAVRNNEGKQLVSVSVNAGAALGGVALLAGAAPLVVISGLIAKYGLNYQFVVIKADGSEKVL